MKRLIFLLLFLGLIPVSCRPDFPYYQIDDLVLEGFTDEFRRRGVNDTTLIEGDTVFLRLFFNQRFVTQTFNLQLCNTLYATKKARNGDYGLKDRLKTITFSSDNEFAGRPSGSNLNDLVRRSEDSQPIEKMVSDLNSHAAALFPAESASYDLLMVNGPGNNLRHRIKISFEFENGKLLEATEDLRWR